MKRIFNAREYAKYWFSKAQIKYKDTTSRPALFETYYLDYSDLSKVVKAKNPGMKQTAGLRKDELQAAFNEYIATVLIEERFEELEPFRCKVHNINPILTWVKAVTGKQDEKDVAIMCHWLWSVKRKAYKMPVKYSIMPIVYGRQGSGKSMALTKLIDPLQNFQMNAKMTQLSDERIFEGLANNLIVLFDELQGIERTDLNALKNQITTKLNSYRKLHTHSVINVPMSCSFIGATNKHINESFSDSTGMRRFYEINALNKIDWDTINGIDYLELWSGIDEKLDEGYLHGTALLDVANAQKALVNEDDIETFMRDYIFEFEGDAYKTVSAKSAYQAYQAWCVENGMKSSLNFVWFCRKLVNRDVPTKTKRVSDRAPLRYFDVSLNSPIGDGPKVFVESGQKVLTFKGDH